VRDRVYVSAFGADEVAVIDTVTNTLVQTFAMAAGPRGLTMPDDGSVLYVASETANVVSVVDPVTGAVDAQISAGTEPYDVALHPDASRLYVSLLGDNAVAVVDTVALDVVTTVAVGQVPRGLDLTSDGGKLYVANELDATVSVIGAGNRSGTVRWRSAVEVLRRTTLALRAPRRGYRSIHVRLHEPGEARRMCHGRASALYTFPDGRYAGGS
jgi:YVTN family beta-propeller protein